MLSVVHSEIPFKCHPILCASGGAITSARSAVSSWFTSLATDWRQASIEQAPEEASEVKDIDESEVKDTDESEGKEIDESDVKDTDESEVKENEQ